MGEFFDDLVPDNQATLSPLECLGYRRPVNEYISGKVPEDFAQFLRTAGVHPDIILAWLTAPADVYICGGALRNYYSWKFMTGEDTDVKDVDMYFKTAEALERTEKQLLAAGFDEVARTERAVTLVLDGEGPAVQLVKSICGTLTDVLNDFDFSVTRVGASATELLKHQRFETELINRTLRYCGSNTPLRSLARAIKYIRYGYSLPVMDMAAIVRDISQAVDFSNQENLETHLKGVSKKFADAKDAGKAVGEIS